MPVFCRACRSAAAQPGGYVLADSTLQKPATKVRSYQEYRAAETLLHDIIHTRLEVRFDWEKQYLHGLATLELRPYFYPQSQLLLDAKGFDVHAVNLVKGARKPPLEYTYDGEELLIDLDKEYNRNENYFVEIDYTAKPNERAVGGSEAITADKGLYFINPLGRRPEKPRQIWTQGETEANSRGFRPSTLPISGAPRKFILPLITSYNTLSNGLLVSSRLLNDSTRARLLEDG